MQPIYDQYSEDNTIVWEDIQFLPNRFEVWHSGQKTKEGEILYPVVLNLEKNSRGILGLEQIKVTHTEVELYDVVSYKNWFDMIGTQGNRILLMTVPTETNINSIGMQALQHKWPHSRYSHQFKSNEPFACSLFTIELLLLENQAYAT